MSTRKAWPSLEQENDLASKSPVSTISNEDWAIIKMEMDKLFKMRIEAERRAEYSPDQVTTTSNLAEDSGEHDVVADPADDKTLWNLNAMSVAAWKSSCWPKGQAWNNRENRFEDQVIRNRRVRSAAQMWIENNICLFFFTIFPMIFVFLEMSILAGMMDQGLNLKTHIYGDGFYQSYVWRYSSAAYLRNNFVPNSTSIGMVSNIDLFGHSILRDRPADEATRCLADDYLMPLNAYQVNAPTLEHSQDNLHEKNYFSFFANVLLLTRRRHLKHAHQ